MNKYKKILIIDDDIDILNSYKFLLRNENLEIDLCSNIEEIENKIIDIDYDTIISDIEIKDINGVDLIVSIEKTKNLKNVIFCSANIDIYKNRIDDLKKYSYLKKPINKDSLISLIRNQ